MATTSRIEVIGNCTLYLSDSAEILPTLKADAVLTDPPYGIDYGGQLKGKGDGHGGSDKNGWKSYDAPEWDKVRPARDLFDAMLACSKHQIIWGGNYFTDFLPPTMQWLVWDKGQRGFSLADCEFAWSSQHKAARIFDYARAKALQDGKAHPTQKPVELMSWCLERLPRDVAVVLDPFMGSGTTGVACVRRGKTFIGIEREVKYFDVSCRRLEDAVSRPDMFAGVPLNDNKPAVTADLFAA